MPHREDEERACSEPSHARRLAGELREHLSPAERVEEAHRETFYFKRKNIQTHSFWAHRVLEETLRQL